MLVTFTRHWGLTGAGEEGTRSWDIILSASAWFPGHIFLPPSLWTDVSPFHVILG